MMVKREKKEDKLTVIFHLSCFYLLFSYRWSDQGGEESEGGGGGGNRAKTAGKSAVAAAAAEKEERKSGMADGGLWGAAKSQWALYSQHGK